MLLQKPHILVIDDEKFSQNIVQKVLGSQEIEITYIDSGEDALEYFNTHTPVNLILLDLLMAGLDGYDVLNTIKGNPLWKNVNVIVMSGLDTEEEIEKVKAMGAACFVPKPINPGELKAAIQAHVQSTG